MFSFLILAALSIQQADDWEPLMMVTAPAAGTNSDFWEVPIEVCGRVASIDKTGPGEAVLYGSRKALIIERRAGEQLRVGDAACLLGVVRRRDGLSVAVARKRQLYEGMAIHGANPVIILRRCSDQPSCERLVPPDSVGFAFPKKSDRQR